MITEVEMFPPFLAHGHAACTDDGVDPDWFFASSRYEVDGADPGLDDEKRFELARAVCLRCVLRPECSSWAIETNQHFGIWGGLSHVQRRRLGAKLGIAPPAAEAE